VRKINERRLKAERAVTPLALVVSHSCDLTNLKPDLEPKVEVVRAKRTAAPEKASASTRSPRKLSLRARDSAGNVGCLLAQIETRQFVDRNLFVAHKPDPDLQLFDEAVKLLAIWMSRRYRRPALPTALVNRLGRKFGKLKELGQKSGAMFSRMFISVRPWHELPSNRNYQVKILALLPATKNHLADEDIVPQAAKNKDSLISWGAPRIDRPLYLPPLELHLDF
jgi:hypothetical protein